MSKETKLPPSLAELGDPNFKQEGFKEEDDNLNDNTSEESDDDEDDELKTKEPKKAKAESKEEPKPKTPEEDKEGKTDKAEEDTEEGEEADDFNFETVNKLVGEEIEGEFTPDHKGIADWGNALVEKRLDKFESELEAKYPREYQALQMALEGQDPSILYKDQSTEDYRKISFDDKDVLQHKQILNKLYALQGVHPEDAEELIKVATDKGKLAERAKVSLAELHQYSANEENIAKEANRNRIAAYNKAIDSFTGSVQEKVSTGELGQFIVPEKDRTNLLNEFRGQLRFNEQEGKFYIVKNIEPKDLEMELQALYFKQKKGDLSSFIQRSAKTINAKGLKANISKTKKVETDNNKKTMGFGLSEVPHS